MTVPHTDRSDLTPAMRAALKAMPVWLTREGFLSHNAPHAGLIRALERRRLVKREPERWVRTPEGDGELVWLESRS